MTPLTDNELGTLLAETFTAHEHLADPDRARALVARSDDPPAAARRGRRAPVLLAAAASVALVVGGTTYLVDRSGPGSAGPTAGPMTQTPTPDGHRPPLPPLQTDAANRAAAVAAADRAAAGLRGYPGATKTDAAGVPELGDRTQSSAHPRRTVQRSRFWTVSGVSAKAVARWYAAHPGAGFRSEGGRHGVGGSGDGTTWIDEVYWDPAGAAPTSQQGTFAEIETTRTSTGVGIRITVSSVWLPARPAASFVQDVTSIDVTVRHDRFGRHDHVTRRSFTVRDPAKVLRAAAAYDALPGMTPMILSCPMMTESWTDRIVFHTPTGEVVAVDNTSSCGSGMSVHRDGHLVRPELSNSASLLDALGVTH